MKKNVFAMAFVAVAMVVMMSVSGCASEVVNEAEPTFINKVDTLMQKVEETLEYSKVLEMKQSVNNDTCFSSLTFDQVSKVLGKNADGDVRFNATLVPQAQASVELQEKFISVDEFVVPTCNEGERIEDENIDTEKYRKYSSLQASDLFSDGQKAMISASSMWQFVEDKMSSMDVDHIEILSVSFKSAELVDTENAEMKKVVLNYAVTYRRTDSGATSELMLSPFYYQVVEKVAEPEINVQGEPYLICDTVMTYKDGKVNCKMVISKVTPNSLEPNDTVKVSQRTLKVASMGQPGGERLFVFQKEMTSNTYEIGEDEVSEGNDGNFSWVETKKAHNFRAEWNTNGLEGVGHGDMIYIFSYNFVYSDPETGKVFSYDFNNELRVVRNEVVVKESSVEGYLGTRVLEVAGYCNGQKFCQYSGETTLIQHPQ